MKVKLFIEQNKVKVDTNRTLMLQLADGKKINVFKWFSDFYEIMDFGLVFYYGMIIMSLFIVQNQMTAWASNFMLFKDLGLILLAIAPFVLYKKVFYKTKYNLSFLSNPTFHFVYMFASLVWVNIVYWLLCNDMSFLYNTMLPLINPKNSIFNLSTPLNISINP